MARLVPLLPANATLAAVRTAASSVNAAIRRIEKAGYTSHAGERLRTVYPTGIRLGRNPTKTQVNLAIRAINAFNTADTSTIKGIKQVDANKRAAFENTLRSYGFEGDFDAAWELLKSRDYDEFFKSELFESDQIMLDIMYEAGRGKIKVDGKDIILSRMQGDDI